MEESDEESKLRFQLELEFVQCLANPSYLQYLAQERYLQNEEFIDYLRYLKYWQKPEYAKFIIYPFALELLDLLIDHESFRSALLLPETAIFIHQKEFFHWQWHRIKHGIESESERKVAAEVDLDDKILKQQFASKQN
ncbi:Mediator of RNA polymerase II transcription subunit 31 [Nowakowskiella sp. JEL0407]|nr:Mediator of RNA polymerase II transcription subunit 31 [Nowakowskiella sp. JEL0407]